MRDHRARPDAARADALAYAARYSERDSTTTLRLCRKLIAAHAIAREAGYSRTPIQNIVDMRVPPQELMDVQMKLARARLERA